ncbi:MAG TPA: hypothetical protein VFH36_05760 [Acidimicrobiales bacterium]|nr:hypothetical protein [Acidimicrobiales bacterium]
MHACLITFLSDMGPARGVARGSIWTRDGRLVASLVQEVLARPG